MARGRLAIRKVKKAGLLKKSDSRPNLFRGLAWATERWSGAQLDATWPEDGGEPC